jgi:hypothetical protein
MTAAELNQLEYTEHERVIRWRVAELTKAGYDWPASMLIAARSDIDLHLAGRLLDGGCPVDTALRILL